MRIITIINQYSGNKGDRAVCFYILKELTKYPDFKIYLSTNDRNNWKNEKIIIENGINLIRWGWDIEGFNPQNRLHWERRRFFRKILFPFLSRRIIKGKKGLGVASLFIDKEFLKAVTNSDIIISTGGHHLTTRFSFDLIGEIFFDIMCVTLLNPKMYFWSQTIGPLYFTKSNIKLSLIKVLEKSKGIFVRDIESKHILKSLGVSSSIIHETFESVIGLNDLINVYKNASLRENIVGITIYNAEKRTDREYKEYCSTIASISDWLIEKGYIIKFFPHEIQNSVINDRKCILDIMELIEEKNQIIFDDNDFSTEKHLYEIAQCKVFLGHKTHSIIFALTVGTPLNAISYHQKTIDFLKQYSLEKNVIEDFNLTLDNFKCKFEFLNTSLDDIGNTQFIKSREIAGILAKDFKNILEC
jgi:polysaccharide pyruvyl transferase WcaK-like protein